jgi:hypothetical protein
VADAAGTGIKAQTSTSRGRVKGRTVTLAYNGIEATSLEGAVWQKASYSNPTGNCVELTKLADGRIAVRNSRHPAGPALVYERAELDAFLRGAKAGEFDGMLTA